ncbi:MAG: hypothetical protein HOV71_10915 [Hamadaea sp.]|nr:hypothetical protein [Hamadaea sp.]
MHARPPRQHPRSGARPGVAAGQAEGGDPRAVRGRGANLPELPRREPPRSAAVAPGDGEAAGLRGVHARARHRDDRPAARRQHEDQRPAGSVEPYAAQRRSAVPGGRGRLQAPAARRRREEEVRRPLRTGLVTGSAALATAAVAAAALGIGGGTGTPAAQAPQQATAPVTRTTLVQTQEVNGTLGYGTPTPVSTATGAVLTWLPTPGATIIRGRAVYRADNRPVVLFYGTLPLYRPLHAGDIGDDVREIERNLAALGYSGITVDSRYTAATAAAVKKWQKAVGLTQTGVLDPAAVVVAPGAIRVAAVQAHPGDHADGPILSYNGTRRVVSVALDVALQNLVKPGNPARVTLPGGQTVDGVLATVGTVATPGVDNQPATIAVTATVADQSKLGGLDEAPVVVAITAAKAENVLTVPVAALVALAEGGYGVQVVDGAGSHYVSVQLGMFADGRVEVTGDGLSEQTKVGVPS